MNQTTDSSLKQDFISRLSTNKQHLLALAIIVILPFILFDDATFGGKQFMGHDTIQWRAGAESTFEHRADFDEEALWATNMFSGMPAYTVSVPKSVPHLDTLFRAATSTIFPAAHFWILMGGLYLFFLLQGLRPLSSLLGSIFISFTTYIPIIIGAGHNSKFIAFVFIPWILVGYWLMTRKKKHKLLSFAVFAIALTLEFRAGHPQVTYYFFYLLGFWWLFDSWQAYKENRLKSWLGTTAQLALAGILGLIGNAQQYWMYMEYSPFSIRGGSALAEGSGGLNLEYAFSWSQGIGELLTLIIPGLFGGSSSEAYWGPKSSTSGPHYLGGVAFILFLVGLIYSRRKNKFLFTGVGFLTMLFSLGYHLEWFNSIMFNYVPYFDKFRTPEMWLIVTVFCFSVVAIFGLETIIETAREKKDDLKPVIIPLGIAAGLAIVFAFGSNALFSFEKPGEFQQYSQQVAQQYNMSPSNPQVRQTVDNYIAVQLKPERKKIARQDSIRFLLIIVVVAALIVAFYKQKLSLGYFLMGLILVSSYDYLSIGDRYTNEESMVSEEIGPEQVLEGQKRDVDEFIMNNIDSGEGWPYRVFPLSDNPFNNAVPSYFYPTIGGYSGAKLSYYQDLIDVIQQKLREGRLYYPVLNMLNVKYIVYNRKLVVPELELVHTGEDTNVLENTGVLPKAFYVDSLVYASSPREAIDSLASAEGFDPSQTAIVEGADEPFEVQADTSASVTVEQYNSRRISIRTERSAPGFLVLSEIYYPKGWEVAIDGEAAEVYKTNYVLRGMPVPAGEHTITMEFNPVSYTWGARLAWISNLLQWGLLLVALALFYRRQTGDR